MRGASARVERTGRSRYAAAGGIAAAAVVAIMALSAVATAGVASPNVFKGATWAPSFSKYLSGCGTNVGILPHWSKLTGIAKFKDAASSMTCPASKGGSKTYSSSSASGYLTVMAPVKFPTGSGGVNVTWNLALASATSGGWIGSSACPTVVYTADYNYGYTWYNYTSVSASCSATGSADIYGYAYVQNLSGGSGAYASNYWSGLYNTSGQYQYNSTYGATYSNSSYWAYNYSYSYAYNYSYGSPGALSGITMPTWFINGTFSSSSKYQVVTYLDVYAGSYVYGYAHAKAAAMVNMATGGNQATLAPLAPW